MKKIALLLGSILCSLISCTSQIQLYHPASQQFVSYDRFLEDCPENAIVVLGEQHYSIKINRLLSHL